MKTVYLDASNNVIAQSNIPRTLAVAQSHNPLIVTVINDAPDEIRMKPFVVTPCTITFYHRLIFGQVGNEITHYNEVTYLDCYKKSRFDEITSRTNEILLDGFTHDGSEFTLSIEFRNHLGMLADLATEGVLTFPRRVICKSEFNTYEIVNGLSLKNLYIAMGQAYESIMTGDVTLKKQIADATSKAAIDAIVDSR